MNKIQLRRAEFGEVHLASENTNDAKQYLKKPDTPDTYE